MNAPTPRFAAEGLRAFALALLAAAGMPDDKAQAVAGILVEGDLMGHTTHGLQLLPSYLREIESGGMRVDGGPSVVNDVPAALTWDGRRLPGPWLVLQAMRAAADRARLCGTGTVVIRRSHHIASLASYHSRATEQGLMLVLACSDPNNASVAPFGGLDPVFTPNPLSAGMPAPGVPVVIDMSTSSTSNGFTRRAHQEGRRLPAAWVMDAQGRVSDDPGVLFREPPGTILPLGGLDAGHKGYGLSLLVEALTAGLGGHGRADAKEGWGSTVFLQVLDPAAFAGREAFERQTGELVRQCHASRPARPGEPVRLPGEQGHALAQAQRAAGVALHAGILEGLQPWAEKLRVALPRPLQAAITPPVPAPAPGS